jgi:hypothetical protein
MRGRRHDSIALPGGRRDNDPDPPPGTRVAVAQSDAGGQMADDLKQTGKPDDTRINVDQEHEVKHWSEKFGVSREELRRAVQQVGPMVKIIKEHLRIWTKPWDRTR